MESMRRAKIGRRGALAAICLLAMAPASAVAFDAAIEAKNFAKLEERNRYEVLTPEFQLRLRQQNDEEATGYPQIFLADPERNPHANICARRQNECAGDVRFYDFAKDKCTPSGPCGLMTPVLFTSRSGATLSGAVWATRAGPAKRPAIVIVNGSVGAPETLYWGFAATLAKRGYVVLTYDPQGQGRSDTLGEAPDEQESVPAQDGEPFYDGPEDALNFLLSTPKKQYKPLPSCTSGTSHAPKQNRRVAAGFNAAYNPMYSLIDRERIGLAGHSFGAAGVSYVGQRDPRVDAIVAWDNLAADNTGGTVTPRDGVTCPSAPASREPVPITKPALAMSADYFLVPQPYTADPDPQSKNAGFNAYKAAGVDSMQVNIRGGSHYEFSFLPGNTINFPFGQATLRGMHMVNWYTDAWFDRYVKGDGTADARLLSDRWRDDAIGRGVDLNTPPDGNLYSFYLRSRYDFNGADGTQLTCDDMRAGCPSMVADGLPANYSYLSEALTPDTSSGKGRP
jgi:dienelactone hydrolase